MVGRLAPWKGQDVFLRAFARAFPDGAEIAVLIGSPLFDEDEFEVQLRALVTSLGIESRVEFRGFQNDVFSELAMVDVLVHASIIPEPFGQVVIEGMAAGLPVVAAGAGGPAEIIVDGETGLLYIPGDIEELSAILKALGRDDQLRRRLGTQARNSVSEYSPERVAEQIEEMYVQVLARCVEGGQHRRKRSSRFGPISKNGSR
jgi:glycosyltransferase involved in cell wall biosynthesis